MRDLPKLKNKIARIQSELLWLEGLLDGKCSDYLDKTKACSSDSIFSATMLISRSVGELIQNVASAWRKELKGKSHV